MTFEISWIFGSFTMWFKTSSNDIIWNYSISFYLKTSSVNEFIVIFIAHYFEKNNPETRYAYSMSLNTMDNGFEYSKSSNSMCPKHCILRNHAICIIIMKEVKISLVWSFGPWFV